ncbi:TetR/AcrR family transcriptional regulator [Amycolatopsis acidiphila]|uniref:TetR/AcrR family transcriptional regulator n=1 Tax=Amycolatopsis acidiphila TaxID=715473 RepID=A0A558ACG5_9PSEU|nr:TetR/AcrR family transcriptional regulator [Amycolatopsis acidiphila]
MRGEILDAASRLLSGLGGEDGLSIRGVARAVGIAPASIYQHFADRAALVRGLRDHEFARLRTLMLQADEQPDPADVVGRVRAQLHAYCTFALGNPGHYRLMVGNGGAAGSPRGPLMDILAVITAAFERCAEAGHPLRLPSDRAAVIVFVGAHGRVALLHSNPSEHGAQAVAAFVDELLTLLFA